MENMWSILMYQYAMLILFIIAIAPNMVSFLDNKYLLASFSCKLICYYTTSKTTANAKPSQLSGIKTARIYENTKTNFTRGSKRCNTELPGKN